MEIKGKRFFALPHMERATKLLLCLILMLLINCSNVFATEMTTEKILEVVQEYNPSYVMSDRIKNRLNGLIEQYNYSTIQVTEAGLRYNFIFVYFYNDILPISGGVVTSTSQNIVEYTIIFNQYDENASSYTTQMEKYFIEPSKWYTESGFYKPGTTEFAPGFEPGATNMDIMKSYKMPYFEFSANEIGTIKNENIPCFYPSSFDTGVNSYTSYKKIGKLYIDENYTLDYIYGAIPIITVTNLEETKTWQYPNYLIFTDNTIENGYKTYYINIDKNYINTPYIYSMKFTSYYPELGQDIYINFALLTKDTQNGGGIIVESGDTQISGDFTKDETTLGDIENSLNAPYNPNNSILNEMNSGDILENLGYETKEDPNQHIWDTIVNGMKSVLCGIGDQVLIFEYKEKKYTVSSSEIKQPEGALKIFTGLAVDFFLLMQMYQFIKKTIDQINEGDLKVMHDVDADCYFF